MLGNFFDIGLESMNLASFMAGMTFAFFNQGLFGKRIGKYIVLYLVGLAAFYGFGYYVEKEARMKYETEYVTDVQVMPLVPIPR